MMTIYMVTFLVAMLAVAGMCRLRTAKLAVAERYQDAFFKAAHQLLDDKELPEPIADFLLAIGQRMTRPSLVRGLLLTDILARLRIFSGESEFYNTSVATLPQEQHHTLCYACAMAMLSLSYRRPLLGPLLRAAMFGSLRPKGDLDCDGDDTPARALAMAPLPKAA